MGGNVGDEGAGAPGGPVYLEEVIGLMCCWNWETLGGNRLSTLLLGIDDGIGEEGGE